MATGCRRPEELLLPALLYDLLLQQRDLCLLLLCLLLALPYLLDLCARTPSTSAEPSGRIRNPMCALAALLGSTCLKPPVCQLFLFRKPSPPPMANDDARLESEPDTQVGHSAGDTRPSPPPATLSHTAHSLGLCAAGSERGGVRGSMDDGTKPAPSPTKVTFTAPHHTAQVSPPTCPSITTLTTPSTSTVKGFSVLPWVRGDCYCEANTPFTCAGCAVNHLCREQAGHREQTLS